MLRYKHHFLIPVIAVSLAGLLACIIRSAVAGKIAVWDAVAASSYIAGVLFVCFGRRRAYRWITFGCFRPSDHICYWLAVKLSLTCVVFGLAGTSVLVRAVVGVGYIVCCSLMRLLLIRVKDRNVYAGPSHMNDIHIV